MFIFVFMKELILTNGKHCLVDDEDYENLSSVNWYYQYTSKKEYARRVITLNFVSTNIYLHRFIMGITDKKVHIDHIDGNGLNNQKSNLRVCSCSDNQKNKVASGKSKYKGVSAHYNNKWMARININGKQKHLGLFITELDAAKAYNIAAIKTGNIFYVLNDI